MFQNTSKIFSNNSILTEDLVKIIEFVLKNNYFDFNSTVKHQIWGMAIGTRFVPPYACIFIDYTEKKTKKEQVQPWIWCRYIDYIFFIQTASGEELGEFLSRLYIFHFNLKFTHSNSRETLNFPYVIIKVLQSIPITDIYYKPAYGYQYLDCD